MALSATLQLRQNQSLVMTPQLMQSIRLLQLTHAELVQYVDQEIEKNPLLEHAPSEHGPVASSAEDDRGDDRDPDSGDGEDWFDANLDNDSIAISERLDASPEDVFPEDSGAIRPDAPELASQWKSMPGSSSLTGDGYQDLDGFAVTPDSLRQIIAEQIVFAFADPIDRAIAADLADQLDESGYLRGDLDETAMRLNVGADRLEIVLHSLQEFDPAGVFARNLGECLAIQLRRKNRFDPAMQALIANLELLARRDFAALRRLCGVDEADLIDMLGEIRRLDPKPGHRYDSTVIQAIQPDVIVRPRSDGLWNVELNPDTLPRVLVDQEYCASVSARHGLKREEQDFLNECMRNANWLTRSLDQRARTIMKVSTEIVRQQSDFLTNGVTALRPLTLKSVADAIDMHESTVSRVTSNKYMLTPRGIFELKFFFSASIAASGGGDSHSSEAVRHRIRRMVDNEDAGHVLSDDVIVRILKGDGIDIARRTVAKYREAMNIASSVQRRREKRALARLEQ